MNRNTHPNDTEPFGTFEEIEAAVRETERGRWFLDEYKRRCQPETRELIASLRRIEQAIHSGPGNAGHTIASLAEKLRGIRSVMPFLAEVSARTAAETARVTKTLGGLSEMEAAALTLDENRTALKAEASKLQMLASEQRAVAENIARCHATLAAVDAGLTGMQPATPAKPAPQQPAQAAADRARIVLTRGDAAPPLPESENSDIQAASTLA